MVLREEAGRDSPPERCPWERPALLPGYRRRKGGQGKLKAPRDSLLDTGLDKCPVRVASGSPQA